MGFRINGGEDMATNAVRTTQLRPTVHKRTEDIFFGMLTALVIVAVFIGFARTYFLAGMFGAKLPSWLVHLHGALFTSWIVLLAAQVVLVSTGRVRWHTRLGVLGMFLAPLMVVVGFATLVAAVRRQFAPPAPLRIILVADTLTLSMFAGLVLWAFLARRDAAAHKRLMLLATCIILAPAISRWSYHFMDSDAAFFIVLDSFVVFLVGYDLWARRSLHRATVWGVLLTAAWQLTYRPLAHSGLLDRVVVWLQKA
jgi:hypothetical protein